jgi:ribonuclease VapC
MIVDSSALIAILRQESTARACSEALGNSSTNRISAGNYLEASIVADATRNPTAYRKFDDLIRLFHIAVEPFTHEQAQIARAAYRDFGKGSGHPAQLNFGDCFAYALAYASDEPLLFTGNDFSATDIRAAVK